MEKQSFQSMQRHSGYPTFFFGLIYLFIYKLAAKEVWHVHYVHVQCIYTVYMYI